MTNSEFYCEIFEYNDTNKRIRNSLNILLSDKISEKYVFMHQEVQLPSKSFNKSLGGIQVFESLGSNDTNDYTHDNRKEYNQNPIQTKCISNDYV